MVDLLIGDRTLTIEETKEPGFYPLVYVNGEPAQIVKRTRLPQAARCRPVDVLTVCTGPEETPNPPLGSTTREGSD